MESTFGKAAPALFGLGALMSLIGGLVSNGSFVGGGIVVILIAIFGGIISELMYSN